MKSVRLGKTWGRFVEGLVEDGRFRDAAGALEAGLRLLKSEEEKLSILRSKVARAENDKRRFTRAEILDDIGDYLDGLPDTKKSARR